MIKKKKGKDPAFLMYSGDFLAGTYTMNYEQKGKYITLMCIHHQKGHLTDVDIRSVLNEEDYLIADKFYKGTDNNWYNQKMVDVIEERKLFTESRRQNGLNGGRPKKTIDKPNDNLNETIEKPSGYHMETICKPSENLLEDEDGDESQDINQGVNQDKNEAEDGSGNINQNQIEFDNDYEVGSEESELEKYYEEEYDKILEEDYAKKQSVNTDIRVETRMKKFDEIFSDI